MIEIREVEIGEILRQIIANGHTVCTVDNLIEKFKGILAFYLSTDDLFQYFMVDTWIEFPYIYLETIPSIFNVFKSKFNLSHRSGNASLLDARERIRCKDRDPNRFEDIHNGMMYYSVGIVW